MAAPLPFFIDVTRLLDRALQGRLPTGVDRVSLEYLRHFGAQAQALVRFGGRWVTLGQADSQRTFAALLSPDAGFARQVRWRVGKSYALNWKRPAPGSVLLNTGHSGLDGTDYARRVRQQGLRAVYFLHDLIPISHPEYCRAGEADKHHRRLETMLMSACGLIFNSAATERALQGYAARKGVPVPPSAVARLAAGRLPPAAAADRPLRGAYFVMLGTIEPRKNHLLLLHVWRELVETLGEAAPRLVLIGQRGWECEQVADLLERCERLRGFVLEVSRCHDDELASWLAHAQALLLPSFTEGYGMPLVEALMQGLPVIASDLQVFRELAEDIPEYLDPLDGPAWKRKVLDYAVPDSTARSVQCARLAAWQAPTWAEHFEQVEGLLGRCLVAN